MTWGKKKKKSRKLGLSNLLLSARYIPNKGKSFSLSFPFIILPTLWHLPGWISGKTENMTEKLQVIFLPG